MKIFPYTYFNGKIIPLKQVKISPNDLGLMRGYAAFDYFRSYNGKIFRFSDHYKRFVSSAKKINLTVPVSQNELEQICLNLLKKNKAKDAGFRAVITGGEDMLSKQATFFVLLEDFFTIPSEIFVKGGALQTREYMRYLPEAKSTNYIENLRLDEKRRRRKILEYIWVWQGKVYEGATSNIFIVKKGKLITPAKDVLLGVTRKVVLELAKKNKIPVETREVAVEELETADEIFITGTNKKVCPITKLNGKSVGAGKVGNITKLLGDKFDDYTKNY
jgi:Branched-chain amino acid aminotransferase/4-amino-4-deoxychorismate lyase